MLGQYTAQSNEDKIMGYWHRYYREDLMGWKVTRILDPSKVPEKDVIWLDEEPTNLDPTNMYYIELDPSIVPPLKFTTDLPGNNTSDAVATYVTLGSAKSFTVAVTGGVAPYTYAWFRRSSNTDNPVGTNAATYSIAAYATGNNGDYFCRVTDADGNMIESKRERTKPAIALSTNLPATVEWTIGSQVALNVAVQASTGLTPYTFEWYKDGEQVTTGVVNTASGSTLNIASVTVEDGGLYYCLAKSSNTNPPNQIKSVECAATTHE